VRDEPGTIPIQNIYYLLCYAWDRLEERDIIDVSGIESTKIADLFAKVLISGIGHLLRKGLDRGYIQHLEDTGCIRGKILFNPTIKRNLRIRAKVACEFDDLNHNILHNQILKTTIRLLTTADNLNDGLRKQMIGLCRTLNGIDEIRLTSGCFGRPQFNRNNTFYDYLLKICELIYDNFLVSEKPGRSKFRSFFQDDRKMPQLFENFVRNFFKYEAPPGYQVKREDIHWDARPLDDHSTGFLPKMVTDISIENAHSKIIIETKYYKEALAKQRDHYNQEKIHSTHFYQLFSYLKNVEKKGGLNKNCSGILLYPAVDSVIRFRYQLDGHKIAVCTLNLNQDWHMIHRNLLELLESEGPG
jgi:5-methylcytosine-specific restriction enzyme subunit McrC